MKTRTIIWLLAIGLVGQVLAQDEIEIRPARPVTPPAVPARPVAPDANQPLFDLANLAFRQSDFEIASRKYEGYLRQGQTHPNARIAIFRLAECWLQMGLADKAANGYHALIKRYRSGAYISEAAFRLAVMHYNEEQHADAERLFGLARDEAQVDEIRIEASYRRAWSLSFLDRKKEALLEFKRVVEEGEGNPFLDASQLRIAYLEKELGDDEKALAAFLPLSGPDSPSHIRSEALMQVGLLYTENEKLEQANRYFQEVLRLPDKSNWKPAAQFGLIRNAHAQGDHQGVVEAYESGVYKFEDETRLKMLMLVGIAYQQLEQFIKAVRVFGIIESFGGEAPERVEAGYRKLICFYNLEDKNMPDFVDFFLKTVAAIDPDSKYIHRALFLKAMHLYHHMDRPGEATQAFEAIRVTKLEDQHLRTFYYDRAWAYAEAKNYGRAAGAFTDFVRGFQDDPAVPTALAQRGFSYQQTKQYTAAIEDYEKVIRDFPEHKAAEFSYQQSAFAYEQMNRVPEMIAQFEGLLEKFPETKAAPEANYKIGTGYFKLEKYAEAVPYLARARELDEVAFGTDCSLQIILCQYALQLVDPLLEEVEFFLEVRDDATRIPPRVLAWLGATLFERDRFEKAERFLALASTPGEPKLTKSLVWRYLAMARLQLGSAESALTAAEAYLETVENVGNQANGAILKAQALRKLSRYDEALAAADVGLALVKEGQLNASLRLEKGDVEMARGNPDEAAKHYVIPALNITHPEVTPRALAGAARALQAAGKRNEAAKYQARLASEYPDF
ncbi:MAG: tetratricopeptide repeat protein [Verrucomicrobiota bacterium]